MTVIQCCYCVADATHVLVFEDDDGPDTIEGYYCLKHGTIRRQDHEGTSRIPVLDPIAKLDQVA